MIKFLIGILVGLIIAFGVVAAAVYVVPEFVSADVTRLTKSKTPDPAPSPPPADLSAQ
jgi:regulator of protease activity HflC (stomatin/prohibitin superfamily)